MTSEQDVLFDRIRDAITDVRASGYEPNAILLHPNALRLPGPFQLSALRRRKLFGTAKNRRRAYKTRPARLRRVALRGRD